MCICTFCTWCLGNEVKVIFFVIIEGNKNFAEVIFLLFYSALLLKKFFASEKSNRYVVCVQVTSAAMKLRMGVNTILDYKRSHVLFQSRMVSLGSTIYSS